QKADSTGVKGISIWHDLARFGTIWHDLARFGTIWHDLARFGAIWCDWRRGVQGPARNWKRQKLPVRAALLPIGRDARAPQNHAHGHASAAPKGAKRQRRSAA